MTVATSTEGEQASLRLGEFRDAMSGDETYGAGRYLDPEPEEHRSADGWLLDFNATYNPTCAYSDRYECPLPPGENWLAVPIAAGEKAYH